MARFRNSRRQRRSFRQTRSTRRIGRAVKSGIGVTTQHDVRGVYHKKTMPRYKKRRWVKFSRRVHFVAEKDLGTRTVVFNASYNFLNTDSGNHGIAYAALYPGNGSTFLADLNTISTIENSADPTSALGETVSASSKFLFQSGILDITCRNTTTRLDAELGPVTEGKLEVDVYEFYSRRQWSDAVTTYATPITMFEKGTGNTARIGGAGNHITPQSRGVTPFDVPLAISYFRLKILKKTKYFLEAGGTFTYQIRDPKNRMIPGYQRRDLLAQKGITKGVFMIAKGLVSGGAIPATDFAVYSNRHYTFTVLQSQTDAAETY